jgi:hypothetical protein
MREVRKRPSFRVAIRLLVALAVTTTLVPAWAASHREAPLIALDPAADITDVYFFRSWADPGKVVLVMNVIPGQEPGDGPNYFNFDDNVLYRLHVDNNQDGVAEDIVYEFRFTTETRPVFGSLNFPLPYVGNPHVPVSQLQGITRLDGPGSEGLTRRQTYTVAEVRGKKRTALFVGQKLVAVPSNAGPATMPGYEGLAAQGIYVDAASGMRVFAGQRAETFYIDLGAVFDTVNLRRFPPLLSPAEDANDGVDPFGVNRFSGANVHTIALEIPISRITLDGQPAESTVVPVVGMYASTSRQKLTIVSRQGKPGRVEGAWTQVARMANPLVNELLIDTPFKDHWNATEPEAEAQFQEFYKNPSLAQAFKLIFGFDVPVTPRPDLMSVLLKYPGQPLAGTDCGSPCAELLRLDLRVSPTSPDGPSWSRLGAALSADPAGWPNGRRPNDDVTDIAIRVVGGPNYVAARAGDGVNFVALPPSTLVSTLFPVTPNGIAKTFPFLPTPHDGRNRRHVDCDEPGGNFCN